MNMPMDYLNEESEELVALHENLVAIECMLRTIAEQWPDANRQERYLTGEETCRLLHISPRTLQSLRDKRTIPFTIVGERTSLYPESKLYGKRLRNYRTGRDACKEDSGPKPFTVPAPIVLNSQCLSDSLHLTADIVLGNPRIVPRHVRVRMSENLGDDVDRHAVLDSQRGERMPCTMRRQILLDIAQVGNLFQIAIDWSNPVEKQIITDAP